jgi:hypothetical protein
MPHTDEDGVSHRDFVLDRAKRIDTLFQSIEGDKDARAKFFNAPQTLGDKFGVTFSHEEAFVISAMKGKSLENLRERLVLSKAGFFDGNCGCAMFEPGGVLARRMNVR